MGEKIFVQSDDRCDDNCDSLKSRADSCGMLKKIASGKKQIVMNMQKRHV